jgi:hypothetical protein
MNKLILWVCMFFVFFILPASGQEEQGADSEPADPDIVLPSVLLEIEDLSIETIDAILPEDEDELLPPEREVPLPDEETLEVKEPAPEVGLPEFDITQPLAGTSFAAEAILGAGFVNHILSEISFYKLGESPRYKLLFSHEMLDGFDFHEAGTGFNSRVDSLETSIKGTAATVDIEAAGSFYEEEQGLQDQSDFYFSHIVRLIDGTTLFSMMPLDILKIYTDFKGSLTSMSLTGAAPPAFDVSYPPAEVIAGGTLGGELMFESVTFGISVGYTYRNILGSDAFELHRLHAQAALGLELPLTFALNGNVGYFYNTDIPWLVPFDIGLSANPGKVFSFQVTGGYRVQENDLYTLWRDYPYSGFPETLSGYSSLPDNHGWFGEGNLTINLTNTYIISLGLALSTNSLLYWYNPYAPYEAGAGEPDELVVEPDPVTGLFPLTPVSDILKTTGEAGLRINIAQWLYLNMEARGFLLSGETTELAWMEALFEGISSDENGNFGGSFSLLLKTDFINEFALPEFDIALFYKISDNIKIIGEGYDLLYPFLENGRILRGPYVSPGIRGTLKVHITF